MNQSERISRDHEECLARLSPEQRETALGETTRLLQRLRDVTRLERLRYEPAKIHAGGDDLFEGLKSQLPGRRITKVKRKKD